MLRNYRKDVLSPYAAKKCISKIGYGKRSKSTFSSSRKIVLLASPETQGKQTYLLKSTVGETHWKRSEKTNGFDAPRVYTKYYSR